MMPISSLKIFLVLTTAGIVVVSAAVLSRSTTGQQLTEHVREALQSIKLGTFTPQTYNLSEKFVTRLTFEKAESGELKLIDKKIYPYPPLRTESIELEQITYGYEFSLFSSDGQLIHRIVVPLSPGRRKFSVFLPPLEGNLVIRDRLEGKVQQMKLSFD